MERRWTVNQFRSTWQCMTAKLRPPPRLLFIFRESTLLFTCINSLHWMWLKIRCYILLNATSEGNIVPESSSSRRELLVSMLTCYVTFLILPRKTIALHWHTRAPSLYRSVLLFIGFNSKLEFCNAYFCLISLKWVTDMWWWALFCVIWDGRGALNVGPMEILNGESIPLNHSQICSIILTNSIEGELFGGGGVVEL